jgi:cytidine deaminase
MSALQITKDDIQLIHEAKKIIEKYYKYGRHHIGAALRTKPGKIFTAVHIDAIVRRAAVCAEAIVLGKAISEGFDEFDTIVAVRHTRPDEKNQIISVVSPCGICRELLSEYGENIRIIITKDGKFKKFYISDLLPYKFSHD